MCESHHSQMTQIGEKFERNPRSGEILRRSSQVDELAVNALVISEIVAKKGEIGCLQYHITKVETLSSRFCTSYP